jgi:hypothetical protein
LRDGIEGRWDRMGDNIEAFPSLRRQMSAMQRDGIV